MAVRSAGLCQFMCHLAGLLHGYVYDLDVFLGFLLKCLGLLDFVDDIEPFVGPSKYGVLVIQPRLNC
jgi:hypothetical protein